MVNDIPCIIKHIQFNTTVKLLNIVSHWRSKVTMKSKSSAIGSQHIIVKAADICQHTSENTRGSLTLASSLSTNP